MSGRLDLTLANAVGRSGWLAARIGVALGVLASVAVTAAAAGWVGASSRGVDISLGRCLVGAGNALPPALLFLGAGYLILGLRPRAAVGVVYGLIVASYVLQLVGALLDAPSWVVGISPFHHLALAPLRPVNASASAAMVAVAVGLTAAGVAAFRRRDIGGA